MVRCCLVELVASSGLTAAPTLLFGRDEGSLEVNQSILIVSFFVRILPQTVSMETVISHVFLLS